MSVRVLKDKIDRYFLSISVTLMSKAMNYPNCDNGQGITE